MSFPAWTQALLQTSLPIHSQSLGGVVFLGTWRTFRRGSPGIWQEEETGQSDLPSLPEEMSNPLLGSYTTPSEEVALSEDRPRALHNKHPLTLWPWPYLGIGKNI